MPNRSPTNPIHADESSLEPSVLEKPEKLGFHNSDSANTLGCQFEEQKAFKLKGCIEALCVGLNLWELKPVDAKTDATRGIGEIWTTAAAAIIAGILQSRLKSRTAVLLHAAIG
jgi:hypothetical protein